MNKCYRMALFQTRLAMHLSACMRGSLSATATISHRHFHHTQIASKTQETDLCKQLKSKIKMTGPITIAEYMKEVLTNPTAGYYMNRDVFGCKGDFTTSPEISQMFGELVGVWCVNEWHAYGSPATVQLVELGPGRGTLAADMCRTFSHFKKMSAATSVHMVEVSPALSKIQAKTLGCETIEEATSDQEAAEGWYMRSPSSSQGVPVYWYKTLYHIPKKFSFFIAHEFLDALPVHKFQLKDGAWHEVLVDVDESESGPHPLRLVLSREPTAATRLLLNADDDKRDHIELCAEAAIVAQTVAKRLVEYGGAALLVDYGHAGDKTDTLRAFKDHALHPLLDSPGTADITADVDFAFLKKNVEKMVTVHGPITQQDFLFNLGIRERLQALLEKASEKQSEQHVSAFTMLCHPEQMGERFKVMCLMPQSEKTEERPEDYVPAGFASPYA